MLFKLQTTLLRFDKSAMTLLKSAKYPPPYGGGYNSTESAKNRARSLTETRY